MPHRPPTGFFLHPASFLHGTGRGHPEHVGRLRALATRVDGLAARWDGDLVTRTPGPAARTDLERVHDRALLDGVAAAAELAAREGALVALDADARLGARSWDAALGSAGGAVEAARDVADGALSNAFVATRPPGHHATPGRAMGFCLVNHVAVAARWLQAEGRAERVLIVDWDVHHGNGTQDAFYGDGDVFYLSLHQWPHYPGTGREDETGSGPGRGTTLNVPLPHGLPAAAYRELWLEALDRVDGAFAPDFVLVSAGFDVMAGDPLGGQRLEPEDLGRMTGDLMERTDGWCGSRLAVMLEGGYVPERVADGAEAVLAALAGRDPEG